MVINHKKYINSLLYGTMLGDSYYTKFGKIEISRADYVYVNWF